VKKEVFKGSEVKGSHRSGSELAAAAILGYAASAYALYTWDANPITGVLLGKCLTPDSCSTGCPAFTAAAMIQAVRWCPTPPSKTGTGCISSYGKL
jgi:hypothetical protein